MNVFAVSGLSYVPRSGGRGRWQVELVPLLVWVVLATGGAPLLAAVVPSILGRCELLVVVVA